MKSSKIQFFGSSDIGQREKNQDFWISLPKENFFALADGMGGHNGGEIAAKLTIESISDYIRQKVFPLKKITLKNQIGLITQAIYETNIRIFQLSCNHHHLKGMGTTLCCIYFKNEKAIYAHVGDSRIYLFRKNQLIKLTDDHSLLQKWKNQDIKPKNTKQNYKNIITRAIGIQKQVLPEVGYASIQQNDIFFLCSDGLTDYVHENQIVSILDKNVNLTFAVSSLIDVAKSNGGKDNITILMIKIAK
jgi:PPM family protein phosphatase